MDGGVLSRQYWNSSYSDPILMIPCHPYCPSCMSSWIHTSCSGCWNRNGNSYQWLLWGSSNIYIYTCNSYCPGAAERYYENDFPGQYFQTAGSTLSSQCNTTCSTCANGWSGQRCTTCVATAALIMNYDLCMSTFLSTD